METHENSHFQLQIVFNTDIDMRDVYSKVAQHEIFERKRCPNLVPEQDLPDGIDHIDFIYDYKRIAVITRKGLSADNVVEILAGKWTGKRDAIKLPDNLNAHPFFAVDVDMHVIYSLANLIAYNLSMRCPPIIMCKPGNGYLGNCYNDSKTGKTTYIAISAKDSKEGFEIIHYAEQLSHEMRHCWQHETSPIEYFSDYKYFDDYPENKRKLYYLQPAEIDARAYALLFINALSGKNYEPNTVFSKVNAAVKKRANQIGKLNIEKRL